VEEMLINMALSIIFGSIKNPARKAKLKTALLKMRNAINGLYPGE
jgi:hypothetical protein